MDVEELGVEVEEVKCVGVEEEEVVLKSRR